MATTYKVRLRLTADASVRQQVYDRLCDILQHLVNLRSQLESIVVDVPTRTVSVTLSDPIPPVQIEHLGLENVP